jgi:hypothetical protein
MPGRERRCPRKRDAEKEAWIGLRCRARILPSFARPPDGSVPATEGLWSPPISRLLPRKESGIWCLAANSYPETGRLRPVPGDGQDRGIVLAWLRIRRSRPRGTRASKPALKSCSAAVSAAVTRPFLPSPARAIADSRQDAGAGATRDATPSAGPAGFASSSPRSLKLIGSCVWYSGQTKTASGRLWERQWRSQVSIRLPDNFLNRSNR